MEQLRARLGRLYVFAEISDEMPTQSVLDRMKVIQEELQAAHAKADGFFGKELTTLNNGLQKEKLRPIAVIDRAEYERQYEKIATPGAGTGKDWRMLMKEMKKD